MEAVYKLLLNEKIGFIFINISLKCTYSHIHTYSLFKLLLVKMSIIILYFSQL